MKRIIVQYYLSNFIGLFIILCLVIFTGERKAEVAQGIGLALALALGLSLLIGTLYYFLQEKWLPKKTKSMLSRSPFTELKQNGFTDEKDFVSGKVNGYTVFVSFSWSTDKTAIDVDVLFNPTSLGEFLKLDELKALTKKYKKYTWDRNAIACSMKYYFKPASYEKVMAEAEKMIEILKKENLKPLSKQESAAMLPELRKWIKANDA